MCDFLYYICFGEDRRYPKILFLESVCGEMIFNKDVSKIEIDTKSYRCYDCDKNQSGTK